MALVKDPLRAVAEQLTGTSANRIQPAKKTATMFDTTIEGEALRQAAHGYQHEEEREELAAHEEDAHDADKAFHRFMDQITGTSLSSIELQSKGRLEEQDVLAADTQKADVADTRVGIIFHDNNHRTYVTGRDLDDYIRSGNVDKNFRMSTIRESQANLIDHYRGQVADIGSVALNPQLAARMAKDPTVKAYAEFAIAKGDQAGLSGIMVANQFWQESRFNPQAVSPAGARGVSQMMPDKVGKFGLTTAADLNDPYKSISAGVAMMTGLSNKMGDQRLALIAYNGGGKAVDFAAEKLGKDKVSFDEWYKFMSDRRESLGTAQKSAWHVETLDYVEKIASGPAAKAVKEDLTAGVAVAKASVSSALAVAAGKPHPAVS